MQFIRSSLVKNRTAATEVLKVDLPTNPLSHLIITLDGYNATDEATFAEIIAFINEIEITHLGRTIVDVQSEDLVGMMAYLLHANPVLTARLATDNQARTIGLIVPFGRKVFNPAECFPATKKGELTLSLDYTAPATSWDNGLLNIEAVEMLGAKPAQYLKSVMQTVSAPGATGDNDVELPIGNRIVGINVRMTTFPATSSSVYGVESVKILKDNIEYGYMHAQAEALVADMALRLQTLAFTIAAQGDIIPDNTIWIDFDPRGDDNWLLDTAGASSVKARLNMGVDEATYLTVMELVKV